MLWHRSLLGLGIFIALAACNPFNSFGNKPVVDFKQNPNPKQRYDITMTIANAPGQFASVESFMQYDVVNSECLPPPDSNPGGYNSPTPTAEPVVTLRKVSDTEYIGTFYTDMMIDEDYYGRGICHWKLIQAGVRLRATGADGETTFFSTLHLEDLIYEKPVTTYFWKEGFPRSETDDYPDLGMSDPSKFKPEIQHNLFSVILVPKEVQP